jgi:hypothetical protein
MANWSNYLLIAALAAVALVLFSGFANMIRGGDPNRSQSLMRWRVGLQFGAVLIILAILLFRH